METPPDLSAPDADTARDADTAFDERRLSDIVRLATRRPDAELDTWSRRPVGHRVDNMTTNSLDRYAGTLTDGTPWSLVAKTLHPASESPYFEMIPDEHREPTLAALNWRDEPRMYRSGLGDQLLGDLRMPRVHAIDESTDRIRIWMDEVVDINSWDPTRYHRTAMALGRLGGAWTGARAIDELGLGHRIVGDLFFGKIVNFDLPTQADDQFWRDPAVADAVDDRYRRDLFDLAERMPAMIGRLDDLPRGICHGDATPHNFLEPGDGTVVAVDWAFCNVDSLASDLGQLLAGRFESGAADTRELDAIASAVFDGYREGLAAESVEIAADVLERAWATHLAIRSVFSALIVDHLPDLDDDVRAELIGRRAVLARFGLDLALKHAGDGIRHAR
jgi:hypothetical protein